MRKIITLICILFLFSITNFIVPKSSFGHKIMNDSYTKEKIAKRYERELKGLDREKKKEVLENIELRLDKIISLDTQLNATKSELKNFAFKHDSQPNILDELGNKMLLLRDEMQREIIDFEKYLANEINYKPQFSRSRSCNIPFNKEWKGH